MFEELKSAEKIYKNDLRDVLKKISKTISIVDLMSATAIIREDSRYVQKDYREKYLEIYIKFFIMRVKDVNEDKTNYKTCVNKNNLIESITLLEKQARIREDKLNDKFPIIYNIISLYTTYVLEEPIHPAGTPFPGDLKVTYDNNTFYCPVKKNNENNPLAVCKFCIAEQTKF